MLYEHMFCQAWKTQVVNDKESYYIFTTIPGNVKQTTSKTVIHSLQQVIVGPYHMGTMWSRKSAVLRLFLDDFFYFEFASARMGCYVSHIREINNHD